jgi:hypothetical protein
MEQSVSAKQEAHATGPWCETVAGITEYSDASEVKKPWPEYLTRPAN